MNWVERFPHLLSVGDLKGVLKHLLKIYLELSKFCFSHLYNQLALSYTRQSAFVDLSLTLISTDFPPALVSVPRKGAIILTVPFPSSHSIPEPCSDFPSSFVWVFLLSPPSKGELKHKSIKREVFFFNYL